MFKKFIQKLRSMLWRLRLKKARGALYYINGPETLPPPLPPERERELLERGASDPAAREELIVHNLRLVVYISKRFECGASNAEDLISIGTIGLIKAVNTFKADKNIRLATYASRCIENEILMYLRKTGNQRTEISLEQPLNIDGDGNELLLGDVLGSDGEEVSRQIENDCEKKMLNDAIDRLPARDREIMCMRFGLYDGTERTQKEVADLLGISQSYISRLEKKIIVSLKEQLEMA